MKHVSFLIFTLVFLGSAIFYAQSKNSYCLMCHSQSTLSTKDSTFGIIKDFSVDTLSYKKSVHAYLNCTDCHSKNFSTFPHSKKVLSENLICTDCHEDTLIVKGEKLNKINSELKKSVHYEAMGNKSDCSFCHDPHTIKLRESQLWKIRDTYPIEDQMCVECHDSEYKWFKGGSQRVNLKAIHSTISKNIKKWQEKKCVDCHTKGNERHNIIFLNGVKDLQKK